MFQCRKKTEKIHPRFPRGIRALIILQLCLAFTALLWTGGYPFMGQLFAVRSKLLLYQTVAGEGELARRTHADSGQLKRNRERFYQLSQQQQVAIQKRHEKLRSLQEDSWTNRLSKSIHILFFEIPPFEQMWMGGAILLSILLLLQVEEAFLAIWLLPLVVACYGWDNQVRGVPERINSEMQLFPTEQVLVNDYLNGRLSAGINEQKEQLEQAWKEYLVAEWLQADPASDPAVFTHQVEEAEYLFLVAWAEATNEEPLDSASFFRRQQPFSLVIVYLLWNLFFAWRVQRAKLPSAKQQINAHSC